MANFFDKSEQNDEEIKNWTEDCMSVEKIEKCVNCLYYSCKRKFYLLNWDDMRDHYTLLVHSIASGELSFTHLPSDWIIMDRFFKRCQTAQDKARRANIRFQKLGWSIYEE